MAAVATVTTLSMAAIRNRSVSSRLAASRTGRCAPANALCRLCAMKARLKSSPKAPKRSGGQTAISQRLSRRLTALLSA